MDYYPYGGTRLDDNFSEDIESYTNTDYESNYKYTGKEEDEGTGLYYYGARYYNAEVGRFISMDTWSGEPQNPQSLNKYSYTMNNPMKYIDVTGKYPVLSEVTDLSDSSFMDSISLQDYANDYSVDKTLNNMADQYDDGFFHSEGSGYGSSNRYVYADEGGWVDLKHFFNAAQVAYNLSYDSAILAGEGLEWTQDYINHPSAYSFEDLTSNTLGAYFGAYYLTDKVDQGYSFSDALEMFFKELGGLSEEDAKENHSTVNIEGYGDWDLPEGYTEDYNEPKKEESSVSKEDIDNKLNK